MKGMKLADTVCALAGMAFSAGAFIKTFGFKRFKNVPVGPEFFPRYLAGGLFLCCLALLIQALARKPAGNRPAPVLSLMDKGIQRLLAGIGIIILYALCWEPVGFLIVTPLAVFALMFLLGLRRFRVMIAFSLGASAVIFCAFRYLLGIDMPMGILGMF